MVGMLECACAPTHLYARVSVGPTGSAHTGRRHDTAPALHRPRAVGVRLSGVSGHVRLMSGMCPVQCPVRCPIMSGSMSEKVSENVRCCPMMSGPFWTVPCASLSGCVRLCPVVSGCVRSCPVVSDYVPWWSLGLPFGLQYHHSTFSKGHMESFHEQSLVAQY